MKKITLLTVTCLLSILPANSQTKATTDQQDVQKTVTTMFQALADRDIASLKNYCTPDLMILESGVVWNLDTIALKLSKPVASDLKRINKIDFIKTEVKDNVAWTTCYNAAEITSNGKLSTRLWLETSVLIKEKNQWRIKTLHSTTMKKAVAP